jgi:signal transduction histidine kinase/ketosteroid isomerase-like protein
VSALRSIVERHLRAFNERDFDAWSELFDDDIEITVDSGSLRGPAAAREYAAGTVQAYPGVLAQLERVVAEGNEEIVVEYRLVNPDGDRAGAWSLEGLVCEILEVREGRIVSLRSYYSPSETDRTDVVNVPSRAEAGRIAEQQAALRRVATLVARGVSRQSVFAAVNREIGGLVGADTTALMRFEPDDTITLVAAWSAHDDDFPVNERRPLDAALRALRDSGRPIRFGPAELPDAGPFVEEARARGIRSSVGVPIAVEGRVWGVSFAASAASEAFPPDTEARIAAFTELVATAIANAQARTELTHLVEEQRALRRVATLVARGADQSEVFDAVAIEASRLVGGDFTALMRYEPRSGGSVIVAVRGAPDEIGPGTTLSGEGDGVVATVLRTGRAARVDDYDGVRGPDEARARRLGVRGSVAAPIVVAGRVWGAITVMSRRDPLPARTEDRLAQFSELVAAAIGNAESRAELTASRARVVATADETRRRIQRDVHDGAQQRLVSTVLTLNLLKEALGDAGGEEAELVDEALEHATQAKAELREVVNGIMPAALNRGGLLAGVHSLAGHLSLPVRVDVLAERLPPALETTAYFVVAEALTNAVKHAHADGVRVTAVSDGDVLRLEVRDDGIGGADRTRGTGLVGLADRVAAAGGTIAITSPPGDGTTISVELPLQPGRVSGSAPLVTQAARLPARSRGHAASNSAPRPA